MEKETPTTIEELAAMIQKTMASKEDVANLATKDELKGLATKDDLEHAEKRLSDKIATLSAKMETKASAAETADLLEEVHGIEKRVEVLEQNTA